ncbi:host cell division inhibitor Icd-like protein [Scandinavium goeteborgense]|uniref:host cell division inhibitor Icd-like protein n=1 Tax=Scandinavium goeteborgense TaxID=1851514 RepID=UPI003806B019
MVNANINTASAGNSALLPLFEYRFMALSRLDVHAKPCRMAIKAISEQEARRQLAGQYVLSFAGCLPVLVVKHA